MKRTLYDPSVRDVVRIPINGKMLIGDLAVPSEPKGLVVFAHGSSSSRLSPRNNYVGEILNHRHLATLLFDLLSEDEDQKIANRFNIELLSSRVLKAIEWISRYELVSGLDIGLFGASTGAAAAMLAAVTLDSPVKAIVSRGGRVDMAYPIIGRIKVPTLLIVGQNDSGVREINEEAFLKLSCHKELAEIPNASHLFEEPHALERVAELAASWFDKYLGGSDVHV